MSRYKVNRIGFVNFWLYDEEDFYFYDGKLLLRGTNGSGKTVTMQSFFPLIFDGNKSPERLDPFGSRDRKIEDYLLSEDFNGNENTGYLYMEFLDKEENKYLTIGIGLRAIKNRNCEFWGFAITDNRRIGTDFLLFRERNLRIPLTKKELQTRIGTGGEFVESAKEYKKMVNKLLFGFKSVDLYSEFINLLIQVRSPKLSNSTRPSQLTKILSTVLEPLSEDDLRVMADSIEDMNKYKEKLVDLENEQKACNSLKNSYQEYNKSVLYTKGDKYLKHKQEQNRIVKELKEKENELEKLLESIKVESENIKNLTLEEQELEHRKSKLDETDLKSISSQLDEIIKEIKNLEIEKTNKEKEKNLKEDNLITNKNELKIKEDELYKIKETFDELLKDLTSYEEEIDFDDAKFYLDDLKKEGLEFKEMSSYINTLKNRVSLLTTLKDIAYKMYQKEAEIEIEKNKYAEINDNLKELEQKRTKISEELLNCTNEFKDSIASASLGNQVLKIDQAKLDNIYSIIDNLEKDMFLKIKEILKTRIYEIKDEININISNNNIKINEYQDKIHKLNNDLESIDTILINTLDDNDTKEYFESNNIAYEYFFKTIEFKEEVPDNVKKQVESFLLQTGVLTSFITNQKIIDSNIKTKCLKEGKLVNNNLTTYLKPLNTPFKDKVNKILQSISINDDSNIKILNNGTFEFAIIEGTVDSNHSLRYIGEVNRTNYITKEKEKINISINQYTKEIDNIKEANIRLDKNINVLDEEYNKFIFPSEIQKSFDDLDKLNIEVKFQNDNLDKIVEIIKNKNNELRVIEEEFNENKKGYYGSTKYLDIKEILDNTNIYFELVKELSINFKDYINKQEFVNYYKLTIENINTDLDNINYELEEIEFKLGNSNNKKKTIDDILNSDKYKDVGLEYKKIRERLSVIKEEIPKKSSIITRNEVESEHISSNINELKINLNDEEILKNVSYKIFMDEYNLHYIDFKELQDNELYHFINSLKPNNTNRDIYEKFNDSLNKYAQYLINYAPKNITLHVNSNFNKYLDFTNDESKKEIIDNMFEDAIRRDLSFNYLGRNVNLLELSNAIDASISSYNTLISDENKRLFEDLLINNIGSSIRSKIWQSEEWINKVRELMESMNTSSGLSFSLKWMGIQAQTEDEVDTKEIVEIFKKDAHNLKQEHLNKITKHFQSKIKMKEESLEESERNYLEIIKEVLDYRKWFEFKLYFKRGNSDRKELTDREFNKMSGGEKAIAMYIPLFSSIYAKLSSAYPNSPHVIALDEAFAGVDDDNIKDAFRILDKLDIDYVLTSQQLWGDYETIRHLAISELHHPIGSKVVSVIKYKWDGISRTKIDDISEYQD